MLPIQEGWAVFPLLPIVDNHCSCGVSCKSIGKHPAWPYAQLRKGDQKPIPDGQGYGICTGTRSGFFVVDLDIKDKKDGLSALDSLGSVPRTLTVQTASGGYHLYFTCPEDFLIFNSASELGPGIDIRGEGGFVAGPGSPGKNNGLYRVVDDSPIARAPTWLLEKLCSQSSLRVRKPADEDAPCTPLWPDTPLFLARMELAQLYLDVRDPCISGKGGDSVLWYTALHLVRTLELPVEVALALVLDSGYNDRCQPPWDPETIERKLHEASTRGNTPCGLAPDGWALPVTPGEEAPAPHVAAPVERIGVRNVRDPDHQYSFLQDVERFSGKCAKALPNEIYNTFLESDDWAGVWQYDEFTKRLWAVNPPMRLQAETCGLSEEDITATQLWFEVRGYLAQRDTIRHAILLAARKLSYHPVRDYLEALPEGSPDLLDTLATELWGSTDPVDNEILKRTLVAACKRVMWPGCKADTILVLYGKQGIFKSTFINALFSPWYRDQMPELNGRDASHALEGYWGIELGELDKLQRLESSTIKDFLSRQTDKYRQFGNGDKVEAPRQCIFIGSTNEEDFLRDATGNRRYQILKIERPIRLDLLQKDQVWAAAYALAKQDYPHWPDAALESKIDEKRREFVQGDAWDGSVEQFLQGKEFVTRDEVYKSIETTTSARDNRGLMRITNILKRLGCTPHFMWVEGMSKRGWTVCKRLADVKKPSRPLPPM